MKVDSAPLMCLKRLKTKTGNLYETDLNVIFSLVSGNTCTPYS